MLAVLLSLGAALGWGVSDFLGGLKSRSMPLLSVLLISQAVALVLLVGIVGSFAGAPPQPRFLLYAAVAGLGEGVGVAALYRGLAVGTMSVVAPVAAIAPAVPLVAGLMLGEIPAPMQNVGLVLAIGGVVVTSRQRRSGEQARRKLLRSILHGLLSALGFGIFFVALDAASEGSVPWALLIARFTSVAAVAAAYVVSRPSLALRKGDFTIMVLMGILIVSADFMYAMATTLGYLSVVAVLGALHTVVTVAMAGIFMHERIARLQGIGIAACICGVLIITAF